MIELFQMLLVPYTLSRTKEPTADAGLRRIKNMLGSVFLKVLHQNVAQRICQQLLAETIDLAQTHRARLFSDVEAAPAETSLRRLKSVIDTLLLEALQESPQHDADQGIFSHRIAVARKQL